MFKLALDAGHGLYTPGKRCLKSLDPKETREWVLNARICDRIQAILNSYDGMKVLRVDDTAGDVDVPLKNRTDKANSWGASLYLSVHHDAGVEGGSGGGATVIVYTSPSKKSLEYQKVIHDCFYGSVGDFGNRDDTMPKKDLHVVRETKMPAVLIECGFMDSKTDVPRILSEEFALHAAQGLAQAVIQIAGLKKREEGFMKECKFTDISGHYAEKHIKELFEMGVVNGVSDTEFQPDEALTRGQAAIMVRNAIRCVTGK